MKFVLLLVLAAGCGERRSQLSSVKSPPRVPTPDTAGISQDRTPAAQSDEDDQLEQLKKQIAALKAEKENAVGEGDDSDAFCQDELTAATAAVEKIQGHPDEEPVLPDSLPGDAVLPDDFDWLIEAICVELYVDPKIRERNDCNQHKAALKRWKAALPIYYEESAQANAALEACLQARQTDSD